MLDGELFEDCDILATQILQNDTLLTDNQKDTLNYYVGISNLETNNAKSVQYFNKVSNRSNIIYNNAQLYSYLISFRNDEYTNAERYINNLNCFNDSLECFKNIQLKQISILKNNSFNGNSINSKCRDIFQLNYMKNIETSYNKMKHKSYFMAGMSSALVPGLGKVYAGKPKQGLSNFFYRSSLRRSNLRKLQNSWYK